jgi:hypothetical protein
MEEGMEGGMEGGRKGEGERERSVQRKAIPPKSLRSNMLKNSHSARSASPTNINTRPVKHCILIHRSCSVSVRRSSSSGSFGVGPEDQHGFKVAAEADGRDERVAVPRMGRG